jgi:hypothetical protein
MVVSEEYAITLDKIMKQMSESALKKVFEYQNPDGGWPVKKGEASTVAGTVWAVLALRAAKVGGLDVSRKVFDKAAEWLDEATAADGTVSPTLPGQEDNATLILSPRGRIGASMLARIFCGIKTSHPEMKAGADKLQEEPFLLMRKQPDCYMDMYFATFVLFQFGGEKWKNWNVLLMRVLPVIQNRSGNLSGSWNPPLAKGIFTDRASSTALATLVLAIYYRGSRFCSFNDSEEPPRVLYNPNGNLGNASFTLLSALYYSKPEWDARCRVVVQLANRCRGLPAAKELLIKALSDEDAFVRANAVRGLGNNGIKSALPDIEKLKDDESPFVRQMVKEALGRLKQ